MISALTHPTENNPSLSNMRAPFAAVSAAEPKEIANAGPILASDDARMMSGEHLSIDLGSQCFPAMLRPPLSAQPTRY